MSKCEEFLKAVDYLMENCREPYTMSEEASAYYEALKSSVDKPEKKEFTDNGKMILTWLREQPEGGIYKSKDIAEGIGINAKSVSGAMRKLINGGYVEKVGKDPVLYGITSSGFDVKFDDE